MTPAACPWYVEKTTASHRGLASHHYLMFIVAIFAVYLATGIYYNMKQHNLRGIEAIPHIEKWRRLPGNAKTQISGFAVFSFNIGRNAFSEIKRRIQGYRKV